jgi:hypothetical protein
MLKRTLRHIGRAAVVPLERQALSSFEAPTDPLRSAKTGEPASLDAGRPEALCALNNRVRAQSMRPLAPCP